MSYVCRLLGHKWHLDPYAWLAVCGRCPHTESLRGWHRMAIEHLIETSKECNP